MFTFLYKDIRQILELLYGEMDINNFDQEMGGLICGGGCNVGRGNG
jgi:hypothetical protein